MENSVDELELELLDFLLFVPPGRSLKPILSPPVLVLPTFYKVKLAAIKYSLNHGYFKTAPVFAELTSFA